MGLFDWFRRRKKLHTQVWMDTQGRLDGLVQAARRALGRGQHVVVVAHFPAGLVELGQRLALAGIPFDTVTAWTRRDDDRLRADAAPRTVAVLSAGLPAPDDAHAAATGPVRLVVLAGELHVLADANQRVRRFAAERPVRGEATAFTSFEDPPVDRILAPAVRTMMERLGMKPDKPVDSPMVTRGIERALRKLATGVRGNRPADSFPEWLRSNLQE